MTDAQIEAVRKWFIEKHACWFTVASLREMFDVARGTPTPAALDAGNTGTDGGEPSSEAQEKSHG